MTEMPTQPFVPEAPSQERVNQVVAQFEQNATIPRGDYSPEKTKPVHDYFYQVGQEKPENEKTIMTASVSKVATMLHMAQMLDKAPETEFSVGHNVISSIIQRSIGRLLEHREIYQEVLDILDLTGEELKAIEEGNLNEDQLAAIRGRFKDEAEIKEFPIPKDELVYAALALSSNEATTFAKEWQETKLGGPFELREALKELVAHYSNTITTTNGYHWIQPDANVGLLSEFGELLDNKVKEYLSGKMTEEERLAIESMTNNGSTFDFDFTTSEMGKDLISKGWRIVEKTGFYPCIIYIEDLAKAGYPPHMILCTTVTLIAPDGQVTTFCQAMAEEVAIPQVEITTKAGYSYPDEWGSDYVNYWYPIKMKLAEKFRAAMAERVKIA